MTTPAAIEFLDMSTDLWWEFEADDWARAYEASKHLNPAGIARQAALNRIALELLLPWLQGEWASTVRPWPRADRLDPIWSLTNGTAFETDDLRIVALPTEDVTTTLRVPQEWADITAWISDYYLLLQVDVDARIACLSGFSTHAHVKERGKFDPFDRTYTLGAAEIVEDINTLFVTRDSGVEMATRIAVEPLPDVTSTRAQSLLERLGQSEVYFPRLELPFALWGRCLSEPWWREALYERRHRTSNILQRRVSNLTDWLRSIPDELPSGWQNLAELSAARGFAFRSVDAISEGVAKAKTIRVGNLECFLTVNVELLEGDRISIQASITPTNPDIDPPIGLTFDLLDEKEAIFQPGKPIETGEYCSIQTFKADRGDSFCLRVSLNREVHEEYFCVQ
ncbi:MAG: DUF1822 family protein [Cyanobacteria bacterium P01_F01_bin.33]